MPLGGGDFGPLNFPTPVFRRGRVNRPRLVFYHTGASMQAREFDKPEIVVIKARRIDGNTSSDDIVKCNHQIHSATVTECVKIGKYAQIERNSGHNPNDDIWFLVRCLNFYRAAFWIISDGEKWLPYDHKMYKITNNFSPSRSVDLTEMTKLDKEIVQIAISHFLFKDSNDADSDANKMPRQTVSSCSSSPLRL